MDPTFEMYADKVKQTMVYKIIIPDAFADKNSDWKMRVFKLF